MSQLVANGLITASVYLLVGISFSLIYTAGRFFHFAHGGVITIGPYTVYLLKVELGLPFAIAFAGGVAASACAGAAAEWCVFRPLRKRGATAAISLLASLGLYVVFQSLISIAFGAAALSLRSGDIPEGMLLFDARFTVSQIWIAIAGVTGCGATWLLLQYTLTGKLIRAVGCDWELAYVHGCSRDRVVMWAFLIGSALAGLAGILVAYDTSLTPFMGFQLLLGGVVAVVIGGVGNIFGIALGAILLSTAQHLVNWWISSAWQDVLVFAIMVLFLLLRPQGFLGTTPRRGNV